MKYKNKKIKCVVGKCLTCEIIESAIKTIENCGIDNKIKSELDFLKSKGFNKSELIKIINGYNDKDRRLEFLRNYSTSIK
ncbi:MAG: hypothetical protein KKD48_00345 [Nanoarchaeota archaeon]|nr:hypothetical protein [Nanoarchaeota archaeon]